MASSDHIRNVAIVGAAGNVGRFIVEALLNTGKHAVTAITRFDSPASFPEAVVAKQVDYNKPETLIEALRGQDALIITISGRAPIQDIEAKLVRAAAEANVPWILPNEWSPDSANEDLVKDVPLFGMKVATRKLIEEIGKSSYIAVVTGFWYEYSLAMPANYGFDFAKRSVTLFDEGETKISTSTWPQIGRAVAALLSLPIKPHGADTEGCLEGLRNKIVYVNSFKVSQKDMLESANRVTGSDDWEIIKVATHERFTTGVKEVQEGKMQGFAKMLYSRIFFPDGCGDFEKGKGTLNSLLNLPNEDIDEGTKVAMERQMAAAKIHG